MVYRTKPWFTSLCSVIPGTHKKRTRRKPLSLPVFGMQIQRHREPLGYHHLQLCLASSPGHSQIYLAAVFPWLRNKVWEWPGDEAKWCQENQKKDTWDCCSTVRIHNWSTRHRNKARQCSLAVYSGFAMQLINHLIDVSFLPQRTGILRPQLAVWSQAALRWYSLCPQAYASIIDTNKHEKFSS